MATLMHNLTAYQTLDALNAEIARATSVACPELCWCHAATSTDIASTPGPIPTEFHSDTIEAFERDIVDFDPFSVVTLRDMRDVCESYGMRSPNGARWIPARLLWCRLADVWECLDGQQDGAL